MVIKDLVKQAIAELSERDTAALDAQLLLAYVLKITRTALYTHLNEAIDI